MMLHDYNGPGRWCRDAIESRYADYARQFGVSTRSDLRPREISSATDKWIYPVMDRVIDGINAGDLACIELGVELVEENCHLPFGKILKSNAARALRRADLTADQRERIRKRVMEMLVAGQTPREFSQYARLVRKIGLGDWWERAQPQLNLANPHVRRYHDYFQRHVVDGESSP